MLLSIIKCNILDHFEAALNFFEYLDIFFLCMEIDYCILEKCRRILNEFILLISTIILKYSVLLVEKRGVISTSLVPFLAQKESDPKFIMNQVAQKESEPVTT